MKTPKLQNETGSAPAPGAVFRALAENSDAPKASKRSVPHHTQEAARGDTSSDGQPSPAATANSSDETASPKTQIFQAYEILRKSSEVSERIKKPAKVWETTKSYGSGVLLVRIDPKGLNPRVGSQARPAMQRGK